MGSFKVGDRVREKDGADIDLVGHWNEHWRSAGEYTGAFYVTSATSHLGGREVITYSAKPDGAGPQIDTKYIEPAPLTIRAGAYYRTRDGRKVGPAKLCPYGLSDKYPWSLGETYLYTNEGKSGSCKQEADLIAEWVDEPAVAAAEPKFRVGDRVAFVDTYASSVAGTEATVVSVDTWGILVDGVDGRSTESPSSLRLVAPATSGKPSIVALIESGQPLPSTRPFVHPDREAAAKEARRLAGKHKGQEFGVYELVSSEKQDKVYEHEWQRLAVSGQKIAAIKEVRSATGFTLKGAKDAVEHWLELNAA